MRSLWALLIYFGAVLLGGALLAPWLYKLAQATIPDSSKSEFHFYVQNSILAVAVLGIWPLARAQGANLREMGLNHPLRERKKFFSGFFWGFVSLAIAALLVLLCGAREIRGLSHLERLPGRLGGIVLTALTVAVLEELLFRGAIFGSLRKTFHWVFALVLSSMIYGISHFFADAAWAGQVTWMSGVQILPAMLGGFFAGHGLVPTFLNLTLAGVLLGLAYQRTGNLWFSIGLHAGWIFWVKFNMTFTDGVPGHFKHFFGTNRLVNGWLAFLVLLATLIIFLRFPVAQKKKDAA